MPRENKSRTNGDSNPGPSPPRRQVPSYAYAGDRAKADDGRSGYGSESVRPYLRAQLRLKELLAPAGNLDSWVKRGARRNGER